jgi:hypothetical protein
MQLSQLTAALPNAAMPAAKVALLFLSVLFLQASVGRQQMQACKGGCKGTSRSPEIHTPTFTQALVIYIAALPLPVLLLLRAAAAMVCTAAHVRHLHGKH